MAEVVEEECVVTAVIRRAVDANAQEYVGRLPDASQKDRQGKFSGFLFFLTYLTLRAPKIGASLAKPART
jgi:hypothetical protein